MAVIPIPETAKVKTPVNGPGPVTRININPYTKAGKVRIIAMMKVKMWATQLGTKLRDERKANGKDKTAPTSVPKKAMATVSNKRYGMPWVEKSVK